MKATGQSETFFGNSDQHVSADRDPDLRLDCVLGSTKKCLDSQVLLDPLEYKNRCPSAHAVVAMKGLFACYRKSSSSYSDHTWVQSS